MNRLPAAGARRRIALSVAAAASLCALTFGPAAQAAPPAPSVTITSPSSGQTVSGAIPWTADANRSSRVDFAIDGVVKWNEFSSPYVFNGDGNTLDTTTLSNGVHTLTVIATGKGGSTAASVTVNVANVAPSTSPTSPPPSPTVSPLALSVTSPTNGATVTGQITWEVAVTSGVVSRVDYSIDGGSTLWTESLAPYVFHGDGNTLDTTTLSNGSHQLTATAYDSTGASARTSVTVNVANSTTSTVAPPSASAPPVISGTAKAGSSLATSTGTWTGNPTAYAYQWSRCSSSGASCAAISGATGSSYMVTSADVGSVLRSTVTASNGAGSGTASSAPTSLATSSTTTSTNTGAALGSALPSRLPASSGAGGTYYVDATAGSDGASGSSTAPWKTINKALATVPLAGSVIIVRPGTYYSQGTNYAITFTRQASTSDPITVKAQTPGTVVIANADPSTWTLGGWTRNASGLRVQGFVFRIGGWTRNASGLRVQGFVFRIGSTPGLNLGSNAFLVENSDRIELSKNTINEVGTCGVMVRGGYNDGDTSDDVWLIDNVFRSASTNVFAQVTGLGFTTDQYFGSKGSHWVYGGQYGSDANYEMRNGSRRLVITNNVFTGTTAGRDIELGPQAQGSFVVNNTFYGNHALTQIGTNTLAAYAGQGVEFFTNSSNPAYQTSGTVVANNVFVDLDGHAAYGSGPSETGNVVTSNISYNLRNGMGYQDRMTMDYEPSYEGTQTLFSLGSNLPDANPQFANAAGFDFHLAAGSSARGAANPAYTYPFDADGLARPDAPALGAFG